jgi:transglutaminase-like putative cysteine protease
MTILSACDMAARRVPMSGARKLDHAARAAKGERAMRLRVGCEFAYESTWQTPAVLLVHARDDDPHHILTETWETLPDVPTHGYRDVYNNRCQRLSLPMGASTLRYDAVVEISGAPDDVDTSAVQHPVEELPDDVILFTLPSRYCLSDALSNTAWELFGGAPLGWGKVQAVCDWIHDNIEYGVKSTPLTTALEVYERRGGVCRDFAHLGVTFCRALNIPARYVFGYMPDIGVPPPYPPMDFHAWFEVYLGDRWWTFDARFNTPRIGRVPIGRGRDAVDVAMVTTWGAAQFRQMTVWADVITEEAGGEHAVAALAGDTDGGLVETRHG